MKYGTHSRGYLARARQRLDEGSFESLFYAAFELRCGIEARLQQYEEALVNITKVNNPTASCGASGGEGTGHPTLAIHPASKLDGYSRSFSIKRRFRCLLNLRIGKGTMLFFEPKPTYRYYFITFPWFYANSAAPKKPLSRALSS